MFNYTVDMPEDENRSVSVETMDFGVMFRVVSAPMMPHTVGKIGIRCVGGAIVTDHEGDFVVISYDNNLERKWLSDAKADVLPKGTTITLKQSEG